jgi:DNA recombination protein RmuC
LMPNGVYFLIGVGLGILIGLVMGLLKNRGGTSNAALENELRSQLQQRDRELAQSREQLQLQTTTLASAEANRDAAQRLLAEARNNFTETLRTTEAAHDKALAELRESFKSLSADALRQTHPEFLRLANETLGRFQESAKGDLAQRQQAIDTLVQPLKEQLESYQRRLAQSETTQSSALGEVKKHLETLALNSQNLSNETLQLRRVLSSNQARGWWGEETLRRVVEAAGMSTHCDFSEQLQAGDSKPDLIVHLPGERVIIVDAKVPDLEFLSGLDSADLATRGEALMLHANKLKATVKALADRDYPAQFPHALDYVVLFLPAESLFSAALEADRDLIVWAASKRIMLATPASLIALLRSASLSWQQHSQTENAREIAQAAQDLFTRVAKFTEHFEKIRSSLERAGSAYNDAVGSFERMVRPAGEKLLKLSGDSAGREITRIEPVPETLRPPPSPR